MVDLEIIDVIIPHMNDLDSLDKVIRIMERDMMDITKSLAVIRKRREEMKTEQSDRTEE